MKNKKVQIWTHYIYKILFERETKKTSEKAARDSRPTGYLSKARCVCVSPKESAAFCYVSAAFANAFRMPVRMLDHNARFGTLCYLHQQPHICQFELSNSPLR